MSTTFHTPRNNVGTTVTVPRAVGGPVTVADGSAFGDTFPLIATAVRGSSVLAILEVTGRSGNTLTVSGAIEGTTDAALLAGDRIEMRPTALALTEVQDAVNALEALGATTVVTTGSYSDPAWLTSLSGAKVSGDIAGNAASITGSITESQVTGLTADLAAKAALAGAAFTGASSVAVTSSTAGFAVTQTYQLPANSSGLISDRISATWNLSNGGSGNYTLSDSRLAELALNLIRNGAALPSGSDIDVLRLSLTGSPNLDGITSAVDHIECRTGGTAVFRVLQDGTLAFGSGGGLIGEVSWGGSPRRLKAVNNSFPLELYANGLPVNVLPSGPTITPISVQGASGQTAPLLAFKDSLGNTTGQVGPNGSFVLPHGDSILAADHDVAASGVWDDTGLSVSLPSAGTYQISANVRNFINVGGGGGFLSFRLYDTAAAAAVSSSERLGALSIPGSGVQVQRTDGHTFLVTAATATTLKLQVFRSDVEGTTAWSVSRVGSDSLGWSTLSYVKLS